MNRLKAVLFASAIVLGAVGTAHAANVTTPSVRVDVGEEGVCQVTNATSNQVLVTIRIYNQDGAWHAEQQRLLQPRGSAKLGYTPPSFGTDLHCGVTVARRSRVRAAMTVESGGSTRAAVSGR